MAPSIQWDVDADLAKTAADVERQYFSFSQSELIGCPEKLKDRCWAAVTAPKWNDNAASILMFVFRVGWEDGQDSKSAVGLKELFEKSLTAKTRMTEKISHAMTNILQQNMKVWMRKNDVDEDELAINPMSAIEGCYFREEAGPIGFISGALMMAGYRNVALDNDESGFLPVLFALREAYGFYRANEPCAARSSLKWARPILSRLESALEGEHRDFVGQCLSATASAAERIEPSETALKMWQETALYFSDGGNDQANCRFRIGSILEKLGKTAEALRSYRTAFDTPGLSDRALKQVIELGISTIRMELESNPSRAQIAPDLAREFGGSAQFPETIQAILTKLAANKPVSDAECSAGISNIREWVAWRKSQDLEDGRSFSMLVVGLKMLLSMGDQSVAPVSMEQLLAEARQLLPLGDVSDRIDFQTILDHLASLE